MTTINDLKHNLAGGSRKNKFLIELTFGSLDSSKFNCLCTSASFPSRQIQTVTVSRHGRKYPVRSETDYGNTYEVTVLDDNQLSLRQFFDSWLTYVDDSTKESSDFYAMKDSRNSFLSKFKNACSAVKDIADGVKTIASNPKAFASRILGKTVGNILGTSYNTPDYQAELTIWQLDTLGNKVYGYNLENVFITGLGEVTYGDSELDSLVEYNVTFTFSEFYSVKPGLLESRNGINNSILKGAHKALSNATGGLL